MTDPEPAGTVLEPSRTDDQAQPDSRLLRPAIVAVAIALAVIAVSVFYVVRGREGVINGSASGGLMGWSARGDGGPIEIRQTDLRDGPDGIDTAVDLRRGSGGGSWARVMVALRNPRDFLEVGQTYRLRVFVRNVTKTPQTVGVLLANENFAHRPSEASEYVSVNDDAWHELSMTLTCTAPVFPDTQVYVALPPSGPMHWQVTGVSLRKIDVPSPPRVGGPPAQTLAFPGPAGSVPDGRVWNHEVGGGGWGNAELQINTASTRNAALDGRGNLLITARREAATGQDGVQRSYTSGRLDTHRKVDLAPGSYVEASITPPVDAGVWPAFWLLGSNIDDVGWPACGELDVISVNASNPTVVRSGLRMATKPDSRRNVAVGDGYESSSTNLGHPLASRPHRYGVYFDDKVVVFYVDRRPTLTYTADEARSTGRDWPFGKDQYLMLTVAIRGRQTPPPAALPATMRVGPISVWRDGVPS